MSSDLITKAEKIVRDARKLRDEKLMLENQVQSLKNELTRLSQQLDEAQKLNTALTDKIKIIKLAQNIGADAESGNTELKRKINEYIKEIDSCIAMLND